MADLARFRSENPAVFVLAAEEPAALQSYLLQQGWLKAGESVASIAKAGEGNMNYTLRVGTGRRTIIVKQSRPWVEKYDFIPAPWDRARVEAAFYQAVAPQPGISIWLPRLLGTDPESRILVLEDLGEAGDLTVLYAGGILAEEELNALGRFLVALHSFGPPSELVPTLRNEAMRALNHAHIFDLPLQAENGLDLDAITPGLAAHARVLREDAAYVARVRELGRRYLANRPDGVLLHGDFFFGSFLRTSAGLRVIDPEFCYLGDPEFDWGVLLAHALLAQQPAALVRRIHQLARSSRPGFDEPLLFAYAGTEIMRRLLGYAQIAPLKLGLQAKARLLERSQTLVVEGATEAIR